MLMIGEKIRAHMLSVLVYGTAIKTDFAMTDLGTTICARQGEEAHVGLPTIIDVSQAQSGQGSFCAQKSRLLSFEEATLRACHKIPVPVPFLELCKLA